MVRTYGAVHATAGRIGQIFDGISGEDDRSRFSVNEISKSKLKPVSADFTKRRLFLESKRSGSVPLFQLAPVQKHVNGNPLQTVERKPIVLPEEKAIFVEPVYGGNYNGISYYDYERQVKEQERQRKEIYLKELQQQAAAQQDQRARNEYEFGGLEYQRHLLLKQRQNSYSAADLQSAGRPAEMTVTYPVPSYGTDYEKYLQAAEKQRKLEYAQMLQKQAEEQQRVRQWDEYGGGGGGGGRSGYTPTFAPATTVAASTLNRRERSVPTDLHLFSEPTTSTYDPLSMSHDRRQSDIYRRRESEDVYDPWGKGGAGAPIRDKNGRLVADRRHLQRSWNQMLDTNMPHDASLNKGYGGLGGLATFADYESGYMAAGARQNSGGYPTEKDFYKEELRKQIDEQKRLRDFEQQREREQDERDRLRIERDLERQKRETEDERRKHEEKTLRAQRRAQETHDASLKTSADPRRNVGNREERRQPPEDGLEWWERQPQRGLVRSTSTPSSRQQRRPKTPAASSYDFHPSGNGNDISGDYSTTAGYTVPQTNGAAPNSDALMRQLSAMRERLNREQIRVKSALRRRDVGEELFDDDSDSDVNSRYAMMAINKNAYQSTKIQTPPPPLLMNNFDNGASDSASLRRPLQPTNAYARFY